MMIRLTALLLTTILAATSADRVHAEGNNQRLSGRIVMGYQGWFACPSDSSRGDWIHWKSKDLLTIDMFPDVTELSPAEKCDSGLRDARGNPVFLFSSLNPKTVDRHFRWLEDYGIDGVALQRFASQLFTAETLERANRVMINVKTAAEAHNRSFFVMYDISGASPDQLKLVADDWERLVEQGIIRSSSYQFDNKRAVLGIWGVGFAGRKLAPADIDEFIRDLRGRSSSYGGLTIIAGTPTFWREGKRDASSDTGWRRIWTEFDVISPWTVGRFSDQKGADYYRRNVLEPDLEETKRLGVAYMPVIFPGFSWHNLRIARQQTNAEPNQIRRACGQFYWRQAYNAISAGATMIYNAMFDEVDEGTAMFKVAPSAQQVPATPSSVTLDIDGCQLPSDWYLRLAGKVGQALSKQSPLTEAMPLPKQTTLPRSIIRSRTGE
ncbi:glycoside hydrolase family 71/99-like protein [Bradyrhizobium sp. HKCCYLS20291]|uniref:glycoside hydrolase family 71/99-like protein n=1 Tax=Bradyrhizobium sp. HKCCYLS20291 TaxID=3420766 RepID=UPI003EBE90B5